MYTYTQPTCIYTYGQAIWLVKQNDWSSNMIGQAIWLGTQNMHRTSEEQWMDLNEYKRYKHACFTER